MEKVAIDDVAPHEYPSGERTHDRRSLSDPLNTTDVAINRYVLDPGERFSGSVHAHMDQEEVFIVVEGEATFVTRDGEVTVEANEAIRFAPGEFQSGKNEGDEAVIAFGIGAPRGSEDVRIAYIPGIGDVTCPECGHDHLRIDPTDAEGLVCPECGERLEVT